MTDKKPKGPGGRPTIFTDEIVEEFFSRMIGGRAISDVCNDPDMPAHTTIYRWAQENTAFRDKITQAKDWRMETYHGRIIELADKVISDPEFDAQRANAAINAYDKAARLQQTKHQRIEHSGEMAIDHKRSWRDLAKG